VHNVTRQPWKLFFMSYGQYERERPWESFSISREGFEIVLTKSCNNSCQKLRFEYARMKLEEGEDLGLYQGETTPAAVQGPF